MEMCCAGNLVVYHIVEVDLRMPVASLPLSARLVYVFPDVESLY